MKTLPPLLSTASLVLLGTFLLSPSFAQTGKKPIRALLIAGGCCHDYAGQHKSLSEGIQARANVRVDVWWSDDKSTNPPLTLYDKDDWAAGYDVVIHDECAAGNKDLAVMKRILDAHQTIPAVHLHCAMHSFRNGTDQWFQHLGIQSSSHGPQEPISVEYVDPEHPITKPLENWTTIKEELYNNVNVFDAHPLAMGRQIVKRDGQEREEVAIVAWTNEKQGARSFSTSLGHNTATVDDARYLDLVVRGLLWATGKLDEDGYLGSAYTDENTVTFEPAKPKTEAPKAVVPSPAPKDASLATVTASSEETGKNNLVWHAIDGDRETRWCAANSAMPQWIQLEFEKPQPLTGAKIVWESAGNSYGYQIETSLDGKAWKTLVRTGDKTPPGDSSLTFDATDAKFLKITCVGTRTGGWASIREISLTGPGLTKLHPKLDAKQAAAAKTTAAAKAKEAADPYAKGGNIAPKIVTLSPKEEADILKDVKVPAGFDLTLFSNWQAANYPVYVAAAPNGALYVSSDGNGSLGRDPGRGRVLRLRDTDGDGRADEVTEFVKEVDSPRGLVWDHDRLYLVHPPHLSVYFDRDGDGIAEESQKLIDGIAFGFADRSADHTTNGLELGIDGWLYIAGGDFGFLKATGTDGRTVQHRAGGVLRVRPDGTGLEIFATGTRNILGTPMSPLCDLFARDNTNDGGGWDVRFHHFTGLEDHGYPRLYQNFPEEHVHPLADYGGGSGCGSVYLHEPGFPDEWNHAPVTCDWGKRASFHHSVQRQGASFVETTAPRPFIEMTRPTDADVDGNSAVYQASWKGPATFKWEGPEVGYIVRVTPKGYQPEPLPDFDKMSDEELIAALDSPSHVRTLAAQRTLLRRPANPVMSEALLAAAENTDKDLKTRVAALYALTLREGAAAESLSELLREKEIAPYALRAVGDIEALPSSWVHEALQKSSDPRTRLEALIAAARRNDLDAADSIAKLLADPDPRVAHTAFQALAKLGAKDAALMALLKGPNPKFAAFALMRMHDVADVVDDLLSTLAEEKRPETRQLLLSVLCRLAQREGEWTGDSWGTRPDTRGPYYQPVKWAETDKILAALQTVLDTAPPEEASFLVKEMSRNRLQSDAALHRILTLAEENPAMIPDAVQQLAGAETIPAEGVALLLRAATDGNSGSVTLRQAISALSQLDGREPFDAILAAFANFDTHLAALRAEGKAASEGDAKAIRFRLIEAEKQLEDAGKTFLEAPKLENHHLLVERIAAEQAGSPEGFWANAAVLALASRTGGSPESHELSRKALDAAWKVPAQKVVLLAAAARTKNRSLDDRILAAANDPDPAVAKAAKSAMQKLKLQPKAEDKTPKIASLAPDQALAAVLAHGSGDAALGEAVFARATCSACHTVSRGEKPKGPYLGNIIETYPRADLAAAILEPNKTIAQGFATNVLRLEDGSTMMGFVTDEQGAQVTLRDIAAQEHTFRKSDIVTRETLPTSMMPPGLMANFSIHETASLLDYLASLVKQ
ncbi:MAG: c-type cytochrome [Verrucomicrobiaceae bacterium]|nr:c-type cytochrome [Verrucomicrobiaceae bacterium]